MKMSHNVAQRTNKVVKPVANRVIVLPLREQIINGVFFEMKQQVWRGRVISVGKDVGFVKLGDYIRIQPMKKRYDMFYWEGEEYVSCKKEWIYVVEQSNGVPLYVNGNRIVLLAHPEDWKSITGRVVVPTVMGAYVRARVVLAASHLKEIKTKDVVWLQKSDYWQYYRVCGAWLFVSDVCNLLCVEET